MKTWAVGGHVFFWARVAAGVGLAAMAFMRSDLRQLELPESWLGVVVFMAANVLANFFPIRLRELEFTVSGVSLVGALMLFPEPIPVVLAVVPSVAADVWARKEWHRTLANGCGEATTVVVAQAFFVASVHDSIWDLNAVEDLLALGVLVVSYYVFSALPPTLMVALARRRPILHILSENLQPIYMDFFGTVMFGVLTGFVWHFQPKLALVLFALGVVIYSAFQLTTRLTHETEVALKTIVDVVDERDEYTFNHSLLVAHYCRLIAERMGADPGQVRLIETAAYLHDIGKIGIDDQSLQKPAPLSAEEYERMKRHPEIGARIVGSFSQFRAGAEIVLAHQEHYDGGGYPRGLRGDEIPLGARIIAVADAYVAMTTDRPYRNAIPQEEALAELRKGIGIQFDPLVCATFIKLVMQASDFQFDPVVEMAELRRRRDLAARA